MIETFGEHEGEPVRRIVITDGALTASVIEWGAVVQGLRLVGHDAPLVLGFETFAPYPAQSPFFGVIAGRVANRIRNARAPLDGRIVGLEANIEGGHHMHGGSRGLGARIWRLAEHGDDFVTLEIVSPDGEMGYPGRMTARCTYRIEDGALRIELDAETDAPTFCNLAHHSYFNLLDGGRTGILDHRLRIAADSYLDTDEDLVAGGPPLPVEATRFDFRAGKAIRVAGDEQPVWDHNYCTGSARGPLREIAELTSPDGALRMTIETTEPGLQFYAGHKIATTAPGLDGIGYGAHSGLCLEPQCWPDAPNNPAYPPIELRPGMPYRQVTRYGFRRPR